MLFFVNFRLARLNRLNRVFDSHRHPTDRRARTSSRPRTTGLFRGVAYNIIRFSGTRHVFFDPCRTMTNARRGLGAIVLDFRGPKPDDRPVSFLIDAIVAPLFPPADARVNVRYLRTLLLCAYVCHAVVKKNYRCKSKIV